MALEPLSCVQQDITVQLSAPPLFAVTTPLIALPVSSRGGEERILSTNTCSLKSCLICSILMMVLLIIQMDLQFDLKTRCFRLFSTRVVFAGSDAEIGCPLGWIAAPETGVLRTSIDAFCTPCEAGSYGTVSGQVGN